MTVGGMDEVRGPGPTGIAAGARRRRSGARDRIRLELPRWTVVGVFAAFLLFSSSTFVAGYWCGQRGVPAPVEVVLRSEPPRRAPAALPLSAATTSTSSVRRTAAPSAPKSSTVAPKSIAVHRDPPGGGFGVQLGAFQTMAELESFVALHSASLAKHAVYAVTAEIPGRGTWHRLRIGREPTKGDAVRVRENLPRELNQGALVVAH